MIFIVYLYQNKPGIPIVIYVQTSGIRSCTKVYKYRYFKAHKQPLLIVCSIDVHKWLMKSGLCQDNRTAIRFLTFFEPFRTVFSPDSTRFLHG